MYLSEMRIRFVKYYKEKGFVNTCLRVLTKFRRSLTNNKYVIFYADLSMITPNNANKKIGTIEIECKKVMTDLKAHEMKQLFVARDPRIVANQLKERFIKGAWLWIVKYNGETAGVVWTIKGHTLKPYFMPLGMGDIHLFDNEMFIAYRGKGINPVLINHVLYELKKLCLTRAFIETRFWNDAEIRSLAKTHFKKIAVARKYALLGKSVTLWYFNKINKNLNQE